MQDIFIYLLLYFLDITYPSQLNMTFDKKII